MTRWAHPRSRGENAVAAIRAPKVGGSSPLTRGKQRECVFIAPFDGLIPAHAGKTTSSVMLISMIWAHPRSRGENGVIDMVAQDNAGSSPLTRGKRRLRRGRAQRHGLIPAHAGKTCGRRDARWDRGAHPRSRGENGDLGRVEDAIMGSSPLTRGKHFLICAFIAQIDQILESLELCAFSESYSSQNVYATDAPRDRVRSIGLAPRSSRGAS